MNQLSKPTALELADRLTSKRKRPGIKKPVTMDAIVRTVEGIFDSENKLQNEVVKRLMPLEEALGFRVIAIPNGGKRRPREAQQFKNRGLRAGFPDLMVLTHGQNEVSYHSENDGWYDNCFEYGHAILIELKTETGSLSGEQVEWHAWLGRMMFPVHVCTSVQSVLTVLRSHGIRV